MMPRRHEGNSRKQFEKDDTMPARPALKYGIVENGGERGIRTLDTGFPVYSLSRRAPSAYSAISPEKSVNLQLSKA
jgi:hypothetical protein